MKRIIKFRGRHIDNARRWFYGDLLQYENGQCAIIRDPFSHYGCEATEIHKRTMVIPESVGQFTGLTDKNGKEIYEGDIVRFRHRDYLVKFMDGMFYASVHEFDKDVYGGFPLHVLTTTADDEYVCEVIGNIYDNPDLLTDKLNKQ